MYQETNTLKKLFGKLSAKWNSAVFIEHLK